MSKVFITKNGQFLSRGGGVLTQIENPDLEVNDIGVEVSEKIAEDVKEGDVLYNYYAGYDPVDMNPPQSQAKWAKFIVNNGELHLLANNSQAPRNTVHVYRNGQWRTITGDSNLDGCKSKGSLAFGGTVVFKDFIYSIANTQAERPHFNLQKLVGERWETLGYPQPLVTDFRWRGGNTNYYGTADDSETSNLLEIDDELHFAVRIYPKDWVNHTSFTGQYVHTYKYNPTTNAITPTNMETSQDVSGVTAGFNNYKLFTVSGVHYMMTRGLGNGFSHSLFKWNSVTDTWEYVKEAASNSLAFSNNYLNEDGHYIPLWNNSFYDLAKFNPVTENYEFYKELPNSNTDLKTFYKKGDNEYVVYTSSISYADTSSYYVPSTTVYKYNNSTSSWDNYGVLESTNTQRRLSTSSTDYYDVNQVDMIEHDGKLFVVFRQNSEGIEIHSKDLSGGDWSRQLWKTPQGNGAVWEFDTLEFSGRTLLFQGNNSPYISEYIASSDSFKNYRVPDINAGIYNRTMNAFIQDGKLKVLAHANNTPVILYEFNEEHEMLFKMATPSGAPTSDIWNNSRTFSVIEASGNDVYAFIHKNSSPYTELYKITDDEWVQQPDFSGFNTGDRGLTDAIYFDNKIFVSYRDRETNYGTSSDARPGIHSYDIAASSWSPVYTVSSIIHGDDASAYYGGIIEPFTVYRRLLFIYEGDLYSIRGLSYERSVVSKYNTTLGGFVEDHIFPGELYTPRIKLRFIDGKPIVVAYGANTGGYSNSYQVWRYEGGGVWKLLDFINQAQVGSDGTFDVEIMKTGNTHSIFWGTYNATPMVRRMIFSDYAGENVWYNRMFDVRSLKNVLATGIALQDGSKGDIIKIRRIKR